MDRTANLLGAVALRLGDAMSAEISAAAGQGGRPGAETAAVALSALHHFLDAPTIDRLRQVLGLTSSGAVRLVDRLQDAGLVRRGTGADGRTTTVVLTAAGRASRCWTMRSASWTPASVPCSRTCSGGSPSG